MIKNKTLVIIAGAAGEIGTEYAQALIALEHTHVVGVIRSTVVRGIHAPNFTQVQCNLDDSVHVEQVFKDVDIESHEHVIFLHTIGVDKFNPRNYPEIKKMQTIDPDVYDTNVNSFKYLLRHVVKRVAAANKAGKQITVRTAIIAGVADKHTPFVIEDFCEAKFILRGYMRSYIDIYPEWFSGLSINVTSTVTRSALKVRPNADTKDWLTPKEVVQKSLSDLTSGPCTYKEIDIIKFSESFVEGYYDNHKMLYEKWSEETGIYSPLMTA